MSKPRWLSGLVATLFVMVAGWAVPAVAKEVVPPIPPDTPPKVRQQIEVLQCDLSFVKGDTCRCLGRMGEAAAPAVPYLVAILSSTEVYRQEIGPNGQSKHHLMGETAAEALASIGRPAAEALLTALRSPNSTIRDNAILGLSKMDDPPIDQLLTLLKAGNKSDLSMPVVQAVVAICREGHRSVPLDRLMRVLPPDGGYAFGQEVVQAIAALPGRQRVEPLLRLLENPSANGHQLAVAGLAPFRDEPRVRDALMAAAREGKDEVRVTAITALSGGTDETVVDLFLKLLQDSQSEVRRAAAAALGAVLVERAAPALTDALKDADAGVREAAVWSLAQTSGRAAIPVLVEMLKDHDPGVRRSVVSVLVDFGDVAATESLIEALRDDSLQVRWMAACGLSQFGDERAVEPLIDALRDGSVEVRCFAVDGLGRLAGPRATEALLAIMRPDYVMPPLEGNVCGSSKGMQFVTAHALGHMGPSVMEALITLLEQAPPDEAKDSSRLRHINFALRLITHQNIQATEGAPWRAWWREHAPVESPAKPSPPPEND